MRNFYLSECNCWQKAKDFHHLRESVSPSLLSEVYRHHPHQQQLHHNCQGKCQAQSVSDSLWKTGGFLQVLVLWRLLAPSQEEQAHYLHHHHQDLESF